MYLFSFISFVRQIYDPHRHPDDTAYYDQNAISDSDENSFVSHGTTCPPNASGQFPYAMDCRQFLNCWEGRGTIQSCAPGTLFNPRSLECDHPSKVKCKSFEEYTKPTTASAAYVSPHSANNGNSYRGQTVSVPAYHQAQQQRAQCPNGATGLYEHPGNCLKFLNCNNGRTVIQDCGPGTAFNSITKVCDWPQNVDCGSRSSSGGSSANVPVSNNGGDDADINHGEDKIDVRSYLHNNEQNTQQRSDWNRHSSPATGTDGFGANYHDSGYNRGPGKSFNLFCDS